MNYLPHGSTSRSSLKFLIISVIGLTVSVHLKAQVLFSPYIDAGKSVVSDGFYIKTSVQGAYQYGKNKAEAGTQIDIKSTSRNVFSAVYLNASRELSIKDFQFEIQGLFMFNASSDEIHESDWGALVNIERKHFTANLGTEFRTYRITRRASEKYGIESNKRLHENWNLIYLLGYHVMPKDYKWNIGVSITNFDHFVISQETNPMVFLDGNYTINKSMTLFAETWYKGVGTFNIYADYYGILFRTGLIWKIDLVK